MGTLLFLCLLLGTASLVVRSKKIQIRTDPLTRNKNPTPICDVRTWSQRVKSWAKRNPTYASNPCLANISQLFDPKPINGCHLAVVDAGMPRSGSTLLLNLIQDALHHIKGLRFHNIRYFRAALHELTLWPTLPPTWCEHFEVFATRDKELLSNLYKPVIVLKSHEYTDEVFNLCENTLVIGSTRNLRDVISSLLKLSWMPRLTPEQLAAYPDGESQYFAERLKPDIMEYNCWKKYSEDMLQLEYSNMTADYGSTALRIASRIKNYFPEYRLDFSEKARGRINNKWRSHDGNFEVPSTKSTTLAIDEAELEYITQYWHEFYVQNSLPTNIPGPSNQT